MTPVRTEVDAAADAMVRLIVAGLVPADRALSACQMVGVGALDLDRARRRYYEPKPPAPVVPGPEHVLDVVCDLYSVPMDALLGPSRARYLVTARQVAMAAVKRVTGRSYPAVGKVFDRDHTTVLHGCRQVQASEEMRRGLHVVELEVKRRINNINNPQLVENQAQNELELRRKYRQQRRIKGGAGWHGPKHA